MLENNIKRGPDTDLPGGLTHEGSRRAVLVGARKNDISEDDFIIGMDELAGLCRALMIEPVGEVVQNIVKEDPATCIGSGKVEEVREVLEDKGADLAVFNNTLSPAQMNNLADALDAEVLDRTGLILNIFTERARSREARLQTDYAHLKYMLPRLVGLRKNLGRQGGTGGSMSNKGSGEKAIELDRRKIEKEMAALRRELSDVSRIRTEQRKKRSASGLPLVALVGYTNAGKSSLMNRLLNDFGADNEKNVYTADMLFATLDTSVRRIEPEGRRPFLLSDTVGFINDLPTDLIQAFRSTLEEALYADVLVDVVDVSDPNFRMHMDVTAQTLKDLGAGDIPIIHVMNKAELISGDYPRVSGDRIYLSVKNNMGLGLLLDAIEDILSAGNTVYNFAVPYADSGVEGILRKEGVVRALSYDADAIHITAEVKPETAGRLKKYIVEEKNNV